jgi:NAD(P)-dependent dehydrogenase (short-subunit alcohol dehydrogenase family)
MPANPFDLSGRVALVTGGGKGLGKAVARGLAQAGAAVVIAGRHEDELRSALDEICAGTGRQGAYIVADHSQRHETERVARQAMERMGQVDILVSNAGQFILQPIDEIVDSDWDRLMKLHLDAAMALTRALAPPMKARGWGRIIYVSSISALISMPGGVIYSASKAALLGLMRAAALDLGPHGITVNCLAPGPFLTDMPRAVLDEEGFREWAKQTALGRWAEPQELVGPALLLASDAGSYITGSTLVVDGGCMAR